MQSTPENLLEIAKTHGLRLTSDVRVDTTGADFLVAHARDEQGGPWVLRAPRRADVLERANNERRVLRLVDARLPVAVPDWKIFSPELIAYPRLPGEPAAVIDMEAGGYVWRFDAAAPPSAFLETLAQVLAALHTIPPSAAAEAGLHVEPPAQVREQWARRMKDAREILDVSESIWARWQAWLAEDRSWPEDSVLIHGDLHPPHILIDDHHRVIGLLDWTEARVSDPATDFTLLFATLGRETLATLLDLYEAAGARIWTHMLDHIAETWSAYPAVLAEFAQASGENAPLDLARVLLAATG